MHVDLVMVATVNGKITRGDDDNIYDWTSPEDSELFFAMIEEASVIVMGARTYEAARSKIRLRPDKLRVVLTNQPEKYSSEMVAGSLEFTAEKPTELVKRLEKAGYAKLLLVGGGTVNAHFMVKNLVNKIHLTIEPIIFGEGKNIFSVVADDRLHFPVTLLLESVKKLNEKGTLHLVYSCCVN